MDLTHSDLKVFWYSQQAKLCDVFTEMVPLSYACCGTFHKRTKWKW